MPLSTQSSIRLVNSESEWRFDWVEFDGDDCFGTFGITVTAQEKVTRFDFGAAATSSLRRLAGFLQDKSQVTEGGGFRNPDIRTYDIHRAGKDYRLVVSTDNGNVEEEFQIEKPETFFDCRFLEEYYGYEK